MLTVKRPRRRWGRRATERGAALVEAAIVTPLFMLLLFASIDGGILFGDNLSVEWGTRAGARAASIAGADALADYDVLQALKQSTVIIPRDSVDRIVVFRADGFDDEPSASCKAGTPTVGTGIGSCNVYYPADFDVKQKDYDTWTADDSWPGATRGDKSTEGPDYVGVWIQARCTCSGEVFGSSGVLHSTTVMRIEPKRL